MEKGGGKVLGGGRGGMVTPKSPVNSLPILTASPIQDNEKKGRGGKRKETV